MKFIWGIESKTTVSLNNLYYTFIFDWLTLILVTYNNSKHLLLKCAAELAPALKVMFSQSLTHGFIPSSLKRAAITPVFKSDTKTSPSNYRPISLTSTIINVFERIIRKQVVAFMNRQGHLNNTQHGFRSGRSCLSALLDVFL